MSFYNMIRSSFTKVELFSTYNRQSDSKLFSAISDLNLYLKRFYNIGVVGVPFNKGQPKTGVELGPEFLRNSGVFQELKVLNPKIDIKDYGDIKYHINNTSPNAFNMINWPHVAELNRSLSNKVYEIIQDKRICLTLGGDHSIGIGSVDGHARACDNLSVLWVDAHADINTNKSSPSGNLHGMPMALLVKELRDQWSNIPLLEWQEPRITLNNLAYIGLRSVDAYERDIIDKYGVAAFDMKDVQRYGIHNVILMALNKIDPQSNRNLHVSFDIDSLDVLEAPSTGTAVRGGLTLREGIEIMETLCETGRMTAMDLVEVNPKIGTVKDVEITIQAAKEIIFAAFGNQRKGMQTS